MAYGKIEETEKALKDYGAAIKLRLDDPAGWLGRARLLAEQGRFAEAIEDYDQTVRLRPDSEEALLDRGHAHGERGDFRSAVVDFDRVLVINPKNAKAFFVPWRGKSTAGRSSRRHQRFHGRHCATTRRHGAVSRPRLVLRHPRRS